MAANCCNRREGGIRGIRRKERERYKLGKKKTIRIERQEETENGIEDDR